MLCMVRFLCVKRVTGVSCYVNFISKRNNAFIPSKDSKTVNFSTSEASEKNTGIKRQMKS